MIVFETLFRILCRLNFLLAIGEAYVDTSLCLD